MMPFVPNSWKQVRTRGKYALFACLTALGCFACGDPEPGPSNPLPGVDAAREASADDGAAGAALDAPSLDVSPDDSRSDTSTDSIVDRSIDGAADRSADATDPDRSIDALDSDRSIDGVGSDQIADGMAADAPDGRTEDAVVADLVASDADAPPLSATCTVDQPCVNGNCQGASCDQSWFCFSHFAPHPCPFDIIPYCGCDGKTYYFPVTCPEVPYEHAGECGDGVNCDPQDVRCKQTEPDCGAGRVASVVGGCYGPCVPITSCRCVFPFECPQRDKYDCNAEQRCDVVR
jgi:hypothetical protein